jgi:hypothetical protein
MSAPSRRQVILLAVLLLVGIAILIFRPFGTSSTPFATAGGPATRGAQGRVAESGVPDVRLELLQREAGQYQNPVRNPFRFERRVTPGAPSGPVRRRQIVEAPPQPEGPPPVPPPPPIPLRYIGYLQPQEGPPRVAVLSNGRGTVIDAKEGDVIEGRYRLLRIGNDSADLVYLDGRGRQTIRLSGQ